jgi:hypothetical protein
VDGVNSVDSPLKNGTGAYVESRSSRSRADGGIVAREVVVVGAMVEPMPYPGEGLGSVRRFGLRAQIFDKAGPRRQTDRSKRNQIDRPEPICGEGRREEAVFKV